MSVNCGCGGCISRGVICVPRGNSRRIVFRVSDSIGDPFDISAADEITFSVYTGKVTSGNVGPGGSFIFEKTLTDGDIVIGGDNASFYVDVAPADSEMPTNRLNYYEANVTTSAGDVYTVSAGIYQSDETAVGV